MSEITLLEELKDFKVVQIHFPCRDGGKLELDCVVKVTSPPGLEARFLSDHLPVKEIDPAGLCILTLDTGAGTHSLMASIEEIEDEHKLKLVAREAVKHDQKREYFRVPAQLPVNCSPLSEKPHPEALPEIIGEVVNISGSGVLVNLSQPVELGKILQLDIVLGDIRPGAINCLASVVRVVERKPGNFEVAFNFEKIETEARDKIITFCFAEQRKRLRLKVRVIDS